MSWLSNFTRPGLKKKTDEAKRDTPDNLWVKDPVSGDLIYRAELETSCWVTPSGFHMRIGPDARFKQMFDDGAWQVIPLPKAPADPLKFKDDKKYVDRLKSARTKVGREDCMAAGYGRVGGAHAVVLVQDFEFMGGSLGMAAGEAFITAAEAAVRRKAALIMVTSSGGARMQEGIMSLMQMPRTTLAIQSLHEAGLPYIVVLADPTTGGVTASYAMLGDIHIAEPGALIGFAGPRVIEQTIRQKLPDGFQRAEYLLDKGMVDMVVDRRQLKATLTTLLSVLMHKRAKAEGEGGEMFELTRFATEEEAEEAPAKPGKRKQSKAPRAKAAE
jgi:acetyl-CoA carboxylase carboxyl transferase subunit beta